MMRRLRRSHSPVSSPILDERSLFVIPGDKLQFSEDGATDLDPVGPVLPVNPTALTDASTQTTSQGDQTFGGAGQEEARKTQKPGANAKTQKASPTRATPTASNCTPSPAKNLLPSYSEYRRLRESG